MTYQQAMNYIHTANQLGTKLGLDTIGTLCRYLDDPQNQLKFIHIAGTNGKGSTAAFLASMLHCAGYRTGLYTSPYLYQFNERICIDGQAITNQALTDCITRVKAAADAMVTDGHPHPTEFELVTAVGFLAFLQAGCDIVVLEVGLGGRFDATNIIPPPVLAVITAIGLDHTEYLGDTLAQIAFEKCGILKPGCAAVCYPALEPEAQTVIRDICRERGCPLTAPELSTLHVRSLGLEGAQFDWNGREGLQIALAGRHQVYNAITAIAAADALAERGFSIPEDCLREGLSRTRWPGRLELLSREPLILADGAHNLDGIQCLTNAIRAFLSERRRILVFGMLRDKAYTNALRLLLPLTDRIFFVTVGSPRAVPAEELKQTAQDICAQEGTSCNMQVCGHPHDALRLALSEAKQDGGAVIAAGSLYLLGDIKSGLDALGITSE